MILEYSSFIFFETISFEIIIKHCMMVKANSCISVADYHVPVKYHCDPLL